MRFGGWGGAVLCFECIEHRVHSRVATAAFWRTQKYFIYRLLTRHDFLPVWLVADK
jgi:hypothetical protein